MKKYLLASAISFVLGLGLGYMIPNANTSNITQLRENSDAYKFINPILLIDNSAIKFSEYNSLKNEVEKIIARDIEEKRAKDISFYFRDINSGKWTGANETHLYAPSSMLKITTLLAYLKMAESDPELLNRGVFYSPTPDTGQFYKPSSTLREGNHTIRELLLQMIIESDNNAMHTLNALHPDKILEVYKKLDLPDPLSQEDDFMSAEVYSRVFRTLYNSTYLTRPYSEEALRVLSRTKFDKGLVFGIATTTTSHKFGEHSLAIDGVIKERELHDCGIVYYPSYPYFICVMTKGDNFDELAEIIGEISKAAYAYVSETKK